MPIFSRFALVEPVPHSLRRSITQVLPGDKLVSFQMDGEDAFGCKEVMLPESFLDKYAIGKQLGSGFSGVVFAVSPRIPQNLAVKIINKATLEPDQVRQRRAGCYSTIFSVDGRVDCVLACVAPY